MAKAARVIPAVIFGIVCLPVVLWILVFVAMTGRSLLAATGLWRYAEQMPTRDWAMMANPPPPPAAMFQQPCPTGTKRRYSVSQAPKIGKPETLQWMSDCVDAEGHPHGRWTEWSADGRLLRTTWWEFPAADGDLSPPGTSAAGKPAAPAGAEAGR